MIHQYFIGTCLFQNIFMLGRAFYLAGFFCAKCLLVPTPGFLYATGLLLRPAFGWPGLHQNFCWYLLFHFVGLT